MKVYKIFIDGVELHHCISADVEKGVATCYVLNVHGDYVIDGACGDSFLTEDKFGEVTIEAPEGVDVIKRELEAADFHSVENDPTVIAEQFVNGFRGGPSTAYGDDEWQDLSESIKADLVKGIVKLINDARNRAYIHKGIDA